MFTHFIALEANNYGSGPRITHPARPYFVPFVTPSPPLCATVAAPLYTPPLPLRAPVAAPSTARSGSPKQAPRRRSKNINDLRISQKRLVVPKIMLTFAADNSTEDGTVAPRTPLNKPRRARVTDPLRRILRCPPPQCHRIANRPLRKKVARHPSVKATHNVS